MHPFSNWEAQTTIVIHPPDSLWLSLTTSTVGEGVEPLECSATAGRSID